MNFLQYKSDEMYSSTQLIRKSKMVFDKLSKNEIDKAVILRDGKPSFLLMDFEKYEKIMLEYMELKEKTKNLKKETVQETKTENVDLKENERINSEASKDNEPKENLTKEEQEQLNKALQDLENLNLDDDEIKKEELKEFWD